jgi:hypothetical protein
MLKNKRLLHQIQKISQFAAQVDCPKLDTVCYASEHSSVSASMANAQPLLKLKIWHINCILV